MSTDEPEGFLGRWSRVKRTAERLVPDPEPGAEPDPARGTDPDAATDPPQAPDDAPEALSEEELAALPRIEDLVPGSDIRAFLRNGVPRSLRNAAMRRMWMLTPGIRDHNDPAVDYAWDWNTPGGVPGDGAAPSPERAAQMLKSLMSPPAEPARIDTAGEGGDGPPIPDERAAPEAADDVAEPPSDPAPESAPNERPATVAEAQDGPEDDPDPVPRRRHGSALPI